MNKLHVLLFLSAALVAASCDNPEPATPVETQPAGSTAEPAVAEPAPDAEALIQAALAGDHRTPAYKERDPYRHPLETLLFFGLEPDMTVVELWPGGGWYTEVLAPVLKDRGRLIVANFPLGDEPEFEAEIARRYEDKLAADPDTYGQVEVIYFHPPGHPSLGEPARADMVLTFRNLHNWIDEGSQEQVFRAAFDVLKPGGVFAVVEHRGDPGMDIATSGESGYVPEDYVIGLAEQTGFELAARSEINANPADDHDHEAGVWTLPPTLGLCRELEEGSAQKAECEAPYRAIGESDRMTLKFVKAGKT